MKNKRLVDMGEWTISGGAKPLSITLIAVVITMS